MSSESKSRKTIAWVLGSAVAGITLLLAAGPVSAGGGWQTQPNNSLVRPPSWTQTGYRISNATAGPTQGARKTYTTNPQKYTITIIPNPPQGEDANSAVLIAHLPEDAQVWFNDRPMKTQGTERQYRTPPLAPGQKYYYAVRVDWNENGKSYSKAERVMVGAGERHHFYLTPEVEKSTVAANLPRLMPSTRTLALVKEAQERTGK